MSERALRLPDPDHLFRASLFALLAGLILSGLAWALAGVDVLEALGWLPECPFRVWLGFACPGCGMTHALVYLSRLELSAGLAANPTAPFLVLAMVGGAVSGRFRGAARGFRSAVLLAIVLLMWLWRVIPQTP